MPREVIGHRMLSLSHDVMRLLSTPIVSKLERKRKHRSEHGRPVANASFATDISDRSDQLILNSGCQEYQLVCNLSTSPFAQLTTIKRRGTKVVSERSARVACTSRSTAFVSAPARTIPPTPRTLSARPFYLSRSGWCGA
jgi:hypothetical protein